MALEPTLTRRSLLRASPALLAPGLLASTALASFPADTPVLRLFREWDAENARLEGEIPDDEFNDAMDDQRALERRIRAEPVTGLLDLAAKVTAATWYGDFPVDASVIAECEALLAGRLA